MTRVRDTVLLALCSAIITSCAENVISTCDQNHIPVNFVAAWDGSRWDDMAGGVDDEVRVITADPKYGYVYFGGKFTHAGGVYTGGVARWDPGTRTWSALSGQLQGDVYALLVVDGVLYIGGYFENIINTDGTSTSLGGFAKWDGSTMAKVGNIQGGVEALALVGSTIWAAGAFSFSQPVGTSSIATFEVATNTWEVIGQANNRVETICQVDQDIMVGGNFSSIDGVNCTGTARYERQLRKWSPMGNLGGNAAVVQPNIDDAHVFRGSVYVVGSFATVGSIESRDIARYDIAGRRWSAIAYPQFARSLVSDANNLYFAGAFDFAGSGSFGGVARYSASDDSYSPLGGGICSTSDFKESGTSFAIARAIAVLGNQVYVGGHFNGAVN